MYPKISQLFVGKETKFVPNNHGSRPIEGCPDQWDNSNMLWQAIPRPLCEKIANLICGK